MRFRILNILVLLLFVFIVGYFFGGRIICCVNEATITQGVIQALDRKLYAYKSEHGRFPDTEEALLQLSGESPSQMPLIDLWGNKIVYFYPARYGKKEFDLYSLGANGFDDHGSDDDVTNWSELSERRYFPLSYWGKRIGLLLCVAVVGIGVFLKRATSARRKKTPSTESIDEKTRVV